MNKRFLLSLTPFLIFGLLCVFLLKGLFSDPTKRDSALLDRPLPEFKLVDLYDDTVIHDRQSLIGQPVLLNVWGTWCTTCKYELPFLTKLREEYGVKIVGIYYEQAHAPQFGQVVDVKDIRVDVTDMLGRWGNPYQYNILDLDRSLSLDLGVTGAPESFLVDANGVIKKHHMGDINERIWRTELAPIWNAMESTDAKN